MLDNLRDDSSHNAKMTLTLALSYGGREEIAAAARKLALQVARGELEPSAIDAGLMAQHIPSLAVGEPDLIIRTGGEKRLSNFLLYGSAYAELFFTERLWPEFSEQDLLV